MTRFLDVFEGVEMSRKNEMKIQMYRRWVSKLAPERVKGLLVAYGVVVREEDTEEDMSAALAGAVFGGKIPMNQIYEG